VDPKRLAPLVAALVACKRDAAPTSDKVLPAPASSSAVAAQVASAVALSALLGGADAGSGAGRQPGARARAALSPKAGERVPIPSGRFSAGSLSGDEGRDPRAEAAATSVALSAYEIDRLPYPNDPAEPPRTDVGQRDASRLCAARGERLCTELEWEYACKGTGGDAYATGEGWDAACAREPTTCGSGFGVLGMGALREWTASEIATLEKDDRPSPAVRGAAPGAEATEHRCARRASVAPATKSRELGFRCCAGPPNGANLPASKLGPVARKIALEPSQLAEIFATIPQLSSLQSIRYFSDPEDPTTVLKRGKTSQGAPDTEGFTLTTSPLLWNPAPGDELVVVLGRGAKDSFIVALYKLPDNRYRLASSLLLVNDLGPFALAFHPEVRERLLWSSCWKCAGEGGAVSLRDGRRVIIVQQ
jgi:formylglycine-generating enzyme required for sulfatase activity